MRKYTKESEIGKQYGYLQIIDFNESKTINSKFIRPTVLVKCLRCNSIPFKTTFRYLNNKKRPTVSCGCLSVDKLRQRNIDRNTTHGLTDHSYYQTCHSAIKRCYPDYKESHNYYDRGIRCFWTMDTIPDFIKYLEDNLPLRQSKETLDRINNDGNYEPGNLRWATKSEQVKNRRTVREFQKIKEQLEKENKILRAENKKLKQQLKDLNNGIT